MSGILFVLMCACFLTALASVSGVSQVLGFCDDWQANIVGIRPIKHVACLVQEFEAASGAVVHKSKTKWLANRRMSGPEKRALKQHWPHATITTKEVVLGTPIGHGIQTIDFVARASSKFEEQRTVLKNVDMSLSMRIVAVNTFLFSLPSYIMRVVMLPHEIVHRFSTEAFRFISSVPFCTDRVLVHLNFFFGITTSLRDLRFDNVAALLATAIRLQRQGSIDAQTFD